MTTHASKETVAARLAQLPYLPMENICKFYEVESIDKLPANKFLRCKQAITKKITAKRVFNVANHLFCCLELLSSGNGNGVN